MGLFPVICRIEKPTMAKNKNVGKPRNYALESGVYRFGKSKTYHKKAVYKFVKKTTPKKAADTKPTFVEKPVKGDKNGGKRMVRVKRLRSDVPTYVRPGRGTSKQFFSKHARSLRPSLQEGTVAIVLAGAHKGKRVLVLKQLASGLVLITGPMKLNGCPMRRINHDYFKRAKAPKGKKAEGGDIFTAKKEEYKPSEQRKTDKANMDKQVLEAVKKHPEGSALKAYFKHIFSLSKGQFPHTMTF